MSSTSYKAGAIGDLFSSSSSSSDKKKKAKKSATTTTKTTTTTTASKIIPGSSLSSLFSEGSQEKFKRAIKPQEFEPKKKVVRDAKGRVKLPRDKSKPKKPKHRKRHQEGGDGEGDDSASTSLAPSSSSSSSSSSLSSEKEKNDSRTIFVGNIPLTADVKSLKRLFKEFGEIETVRLRSVPIAGTAIDDHGNQDLVKKVCSNSRKFGDQKGSFNAYVVFKTAEAATASLSCNNHVLEKRHLRVDRSGNEGPFFFF